MAGPDEGRRRLLLVALGAGTAAAAGAPVVTALVDPVGKRTVVEGDGFVDVAALEDLPHHKPYRAMVRADLTDAWTVYRNQDLGAVFLIRGPTDDVTAFSTICPHLGCIVEHDDEKKQFVCPCHDSAFSEKGAVLTGPSHRGLYDLETRVADGRVLVRFQRFG
jgi:Rieske Fe-S protein